MSRSVMVVVKAEEVAKAINQGALHANAYALKDITPIGDGSKYTIVMESATAANPETDTVFFTNKAKLDLEV